MTASRGTLRSASCAAVSAVPDASHGVALILPVQDEGLRFGISERGGGDGGPVSPDQCRAERCGSKT